MRLSRSSIVWGLALVSGIAVSAMLAPWIAPNPNHVDLEAVLSPPSLTHWLGTDGLGRDVASRLVHGARVSLLIGLTTASLSILIGLPIGAVAGYAGGAVDAALSRVIEAALCFPGLVITIALLSIGPSWLLQLPETVRIALALSLIGWTQAARYLRGEFRRLKSSESIVSARAAGAGHLRIVVRHLLPQSLGPVLVTMAFGVGGAALAEATLSFIGVGISPPTSSWGELLFQALHHVGRAWWLAFFPGAALFVLLIGCNELAEGLRVKLDPEAAGGVSPGRFLRDLCIVLVVTGCVVWGVTRWLTIPWAVAGPSMQPSLSDGDRVMVNLITLRRRLPRTGEVVLLSGPGGEDMVKRIAPEPYPGAAPYPAPTLPPESPLEPTYVVLGDNPGRSRDSREFGRVPLHRIRGIVAWRYWPLSRLGEIK